MNFGGATRRQFGHDLGQAGLPTLTPHKNPGYALHIQTMLFRYGTVCLLVRLKNASDR